MSPRVCQHPDCDHGMEGRHPAARFCSDACRAAAWKLRTGYGRHDRVVPYDDRPADEARALPRRARANGRPATRRKPSGLQVSYRKAIDVLADYLRASEDALELTQDPRDEAEAILCDALSDKQRARLDAQREEARRGS